ncbi:MAG: peptidoglycan-binding protein [Bifidobacteriaceae bacterium]|jgi:peptidoglycan hydrolase-like protein with peptidoglycan-binding domain|nr:peptidoglycan-binding protein [Bifidobacteriaceae bacterium]
MNMPQAQRKQWLLGGGLLGAFVAVAAGAWWGANLMQSPEQREAAASPPAPSTVLATVTRGDLNDETTLKATVVQEGHRTVDLTLGDGREVVTKNDLGEGESVSNGDVILRVNSRPVFVFEGFFPAWRDIGEGDVGEDVAQLQAALAKSGFGLRADGEFGPSTKRAVDALYAAAGTSPARREAALGSDEGGSGEGAGATGETGASAVRKAARQTVIPASEMVFVPALPLVVVEAPPLGTSLTAENARLILGQTGFALRAEVPRAVAAQVEKTGRAWAESSGTRVELAVEAAGEKSDSSAQPDAGESGVDGSGTGVSLILRPPAGAQTQVPELWSNGAQVLVTLVLSEPIADGLLVPKAAVSADGGGQSRVVVEDQAGQATVVSVTELKCVAGQCVVQPVEPGQLREGQRVRVGFA